MTEREMTRDGGICIKFSPLGISQDIYLTLTVPEVWHIFNIVLSIPSPHIISPSHIPGPDTERLQCTSVTVSRCKEVNSPANQTDFK